jgi:type VI secretion system protein ImpL
VSALGAARERCGPGADGASRFIWNDNLLRQSIQLAEAYGSFQRDKLAQFVKPVRDVTKQTAVDLLGQNMQALVAQARKVERVPRVWNDAGALQDEIASEVADLRRVSEPLRQVIDTYDKVGLRSAFLEQYRQVADDKQEILRRLDQLLDREDLYRISGKLTQWRGERAPVLDAFDVNDPDALGQYVKATRGRLRIWARDLAKVPVTILDGLGSGAIGDTDPLSRKWREINDNLDAFEKMTPGNSVREMETFLDTTLMAVTPDNCLDRLPKRTGDQRDYFQQHRARVYDAVRRRCLHFAEEKILSLYRRLAERFNRDLGGKFPFVRNTQLTEPQDVAPRDLRAFFLDFDEFMQKYDSFFARGESADVVGLGREIDSFLNSLRTMRVLFAPVITEAASDAAKYGIQIQYRVNRQSEINGSQVAEWVLALGDQRLDEGQGQWQVGDRVRLTLRWAKDGPYVPSLKDQVASAAVDGDAISFEFGGFWSMLRLLRTFRAQPADMRRAVDQRPHVLKLIVELAERKGTGRLRILPDSYYTGKGDVPSGGTARIAFQYSKAILFVRVGIAPADSKDSLTVPAEFPTKAPLPRALEERH